jgi:hypothetical protein
LNLAKSGRVGERIIRRRISEVKCVHVCIKAIEDSLSSAQKDIGDPWWKAQKVKETFLAML